MLKGVEVWSEEGLWKSQVKQYFVSYSLVTPFSRNFGATLNQFICESKYCKKNLVLITSSKPKGNTTIQLIKTNEVMQLINLYMWPIDLRIFAMDINL